MSRLEHTCDAVAVRDRGNARASIETITSVAAQIADVRASLLGDAAATATDAAAVDGAIDAALAELNGASVHAFIGVLVERMVREQLHLPRAGLGRGTALTDDSVVVTRDR
ncbi:three-helix bundle dimerization domain-containing protein [Pseudonocardia sp. GCM10023141]|uniref:three-helix bundle dimerization domain-containing protein n=1 Tax=Pseudonocardia sp. GCM10023141 TaxID=3252653 RepID=UPI00361054BD